MTLDEVLLILKKFKIELSKTMNFDSIWLFGSYARGNAFMHSDIDVAVMVTQIDDEYMNIVKNLWKIGSAVDVRIEPVLILPEEDITGFAKEIVRT